MKQLTAMDKKELEKRIEESYEKHRAQTLEHPYHWGREKWNQVYRDAGMTEKEIEAYRREQEMNSAALNDPLDAYRD